MRSINLIWLFALVLTISTSCNNSESDNKKDRTEKVRKGGKDKKDRGQRNQDGPTQQLTTEQMSKRLTQAYDLTEEQSSEVTTILKNENFDDLSIDNQKSLLAGLRNQIMSEIITPEQMEVLKERRKSANKGQQGERKKGERRKQNVSLLDRINKLADLSSDQEIQVKTMIEESGVEKMSGEEQKTTTKELRERIMNEVLTEEQRAKLPTKSEQQ